MYPNQGYQQQQNYQQQQGYQQQGQQGGGKKLYPYDQQNGAKGVSISLYASKFPGQFYSSVLGTVQDLINALQQANIGPNDPIKVTVKPPKPGSQTQAALKMNISFAKNSPNFQGNQQGQVQYPQQQVNHGGYSVPYQQPQQYNTGNMPMNPNFATSLGAPGYGNAMPSQPPQQQAHQQAQTIPQGDLPFDEEDPF